MSQFVCSSPNSEKFADQKILEINYFLSAAFLRQRLQNTLLASMITTSSLSPTKSRGHPTAGSAQILRMN
jgi:hypothetical protein